MGLSVGIAGGIVMFGIVTVVMMFPNIIDATTSVTHASSMVSDVEDSILRTDISIETVNATSLSNILNFTITNTGNEKLWTYDKFTIITTYESGVVTKTKYTDQFVYQNSCTNTPNTWCISKFWRDFQDPLIINPDEAITIIGMLNHPVYPNGIVTVLVSTDNGVLTSKSITAS